MKELVELLEEINKSIDFEQEQGLMTDNVIDSVCLVEIVSMLEDKFNVEIDIDDITPQNFDSAVKINAMLCAKKSGERQGE